MRNSDLHRLMIVLHLLMFSMVVGIGAYAAQVENLIRNGDFEEGTIEWELRTSEGAVARMEEAKESVKGQSCVFIKIDAVPGKTYWHLALYQEGHQLKKGQTYTFSFWAKAVKTRPAVCYIEQTVDPFDEYGRKVIEISEEWQEYWTTFTATLSEGVWPRIALGESVVSVWVDNVRFYQGDYVKEEGLGTQKAVNPAGKLPISWASLKKP